MSAGATATVPIPGASPVPVPMEQLLTLLPDPAALSARFTTYRDNGDLLDNVRRQFAQLIDVCPGKRARFNLRGRALLGNAGAVRQAAIGIADTILGAKWPEDSVVPSEAAAMRAVLQHFPDVQAARQLSSPSAHTHVVAGILTLLYTFAARAHDASIQTIAIFPWLHELWPPMPAAARCSWCALVPVAMDMVLSRAGRRDGRVLGRVLRQFFHSAA